MPDHEPHESHGHSVAAWTAVTIILVATLVMSLAVVFPSTPWFLVGAALVVVGVAAGKILAMAGFGARAGTEETARGERGPALPEPGRSQTESGIQ